MYARGLKLHTVRTHFLHDVHSCCSSLALHELYVLTYTLYSKFEPIIIFTKASQCYVKHNWTEYFLKVVFFNIFTIYLRTSDYCCKKLIKLSVKQKCKIDFRKFSPQCVYKLCKGGVIFLLGSSSLRKKNELHQSSNRIASSPHLNKCVPQRLRKNTLVQNFSST